MLSGDRFVTVTVPHEGTFMEDPVELPFFVNQETESNLNGMAEVSYSDGGARDRAKLPGTYTMPLARRVYSPLNLPINKIFCLLVYKKKKIKQWRNYLFFFPIQENTQIILQRHCSSE